MQQIFAKHSEGCRTIGIGSGRTMEVFSSVLSNDRVYVPTSHQAEMFLGSKSMSSCGNHQVLDLYLDGTDYYNAEGDLIKGNGGAVTLERLLCSMARKTVIVAQRSKFRESFEGLLVPVVILRQSYGYFMSKLGEHSIKGHLRKVRGVTPFVTDQGNLIVDVDFDADFLRKCNRIAGVVENGYFERASSIVIEEIDDELGCSPRAEEMAL